MNKLPDAKADSTTDLRSELQPGIYRHFKGGEYQVYETALHSETEECLVVYRPLYGEKKMWVRPYELFTESVEIEGEMLPRFKFLREAL